METEKTANEGTYVINEPFTSVLNMARSEMVHVVLMIKVTCYTALSFFLYMRSDINVGVSRLDIVIHTIIITKE
jgi:hypothetical protein